MTREKRSEKGRKGRTGKEKRSWGGNLSWAI